MSHLDARTHWTDTLLLILRDPEPSRHQPAARLLELFADRSRGAAIEAIAVDDTRDDWVRIYALRAMHRRAVPLSLPGLTSLLTEFEHRPTSTARHSGFASDDNVLLLVGLAIDAAHDAAIREFLASLAPTVARDLLCTEATSAVRLSPPLRDLVYQRCVDSGALDDELAWHTLDRPESRARVPDGSGGGVERLRAASRRLNGEAIAAIQRERPGLFAAAIEQLALPLDVLRAHASSERLMALARQRLRDFDEKRRPARAAWAAVRILASEPGAVETLDAMCADVTLAPALRQAAAAQRATCLPAPDFGQLPRAGIATSLRWLRDPAPANRALLAWASESDVPAFRYAGASGLLALDGYVAHADLIDRLARGAEPLVRMVALGAQAASGSAAALTALVETARSSDHVVVRARAMRSLAALATRPINFDELCQQLLREEPASYDSYYTPLASEAALGLARHPATSESGALDALVDAALAIRHDDEWWAIAAAISSWLDGTEAAINPVWYWTFLYPADRAGAA